MKKASMRKRIILLIALLLLSTLFSLIIGYICYVRMESRLENARQFVASEESKIRYAIESRVTTAKALEIYVVSSKGDIETFEEVASYFYDDDPILRSIQLAPNGVVQSKYMFPKEEDFADHDLFADPERREDAERARDTNQVTISKVVDLRQGGRGIVIRNPIFIPDENGEDVFWGFSIVVFNVPEVFHVDSLNLLTDESYYYRLWNEGPSPDDIQVVVENTNQPMKNAIREDIEVYDSMWYLDIVPQDNWLPRKLLMELIATFALILILSLTALAAHLKVREVVYFDSLLHIGNGNFLALAFQKLSQRHSKELYLVVFDIDKFKEFNYLYGEEVGDRLLQYIVRVFQEELPKTRLFRYFSDFFITLMECGSQRECEENIERLLLRINQDIEKGSIQPFDISAGIRRVEKGESLQRSISDALIARGTIKGNHLRHLAAYSDDIRLKRVDYMAMESNFAKALRSKEFCVYYQPKYDIRTGKIIGAEALTRWVKADGSVVQPGAFIPCFEESRQIILLDEYILREVCRQMRRMQMVGLEVRPVSVNLSRVHLRHHDVLPKISAIIRESGIDPANLSFEITESALLEESIPMETILKRLHELGCKVDMDDYGVGASNLDALMSNDFDMLKLDKSIVDRIGDERTQDLLRSTIEMATKWGMEVLAEGVESLPQAEQLLALGCSYAQGYYYSKPVPEADYWTLLAMQS